MGTVTYDPDTRMVTANFGDIPPSHYENWVWVNGGNLVGNQNNAWVQSSAMYSNVSVGNAPEPINYGGGDAGAHIEESKYKVSVTIPPIPSDWHVVIHFGREGTITHAKISYDAHGRTKVTGHYYTKDPAWNPFGNPATGTWDYDFGYAGDQNVSKTLTTDYIWIQATAFPTGGHVGDWDVRGFRLEDHILGVEIGPY